MRLLLGVRSSVVILALLGLAAGPTVTVGQQSDASTTSAAQAIERVQLRLSAAINAGFSQQARARRRRPRSGSSSNVGYVDNAIVGDMFTLRYDDAHEAVMPDRAEFIYGKCGCFRVLGADPDAPGPAGSGNTLIEPSLDFQDVVLDAEVALSDRFSVFAEVPFRSVKGEVLMDGSGLSDIRAGFKFALVATEDRYLTFQLKAYFPTGDAGQGLGTDHTSIEPAILYHDGAAEPFKFEAELRLWIPTGGSSGAGTGVTTQDNYYGSVLRYGIGLGYDLTPDASVRLTPVVELVAWRVLGGIGTQSMDGTLDSVVIADASGTNIANLKVGFRFGIRESDSIFAGYGKALTNAWWYDDIIRIEYRFVP
ncbi:MAG: hypothetical protein ACC667_09495 [Longimicrobiales bacterium]